jgi:hypothetical protein
MNKPAKRPMLYDEARACADKIKANLKKIRQLVVDLHDRKGWAALGYGSWTECVQKEFKQSERYIFYQYKAAEIEMNVSDCTMVQLGAIPERQLRPLAKLRDNPEQQRAAWQQAVATAPDGKVTAAHVNKVVNGMITMGHEKARPERQPQIPLDAIQLAETAIKQLDLIKPDDPRREEVLRKIKKWMKKNSARSEHKKPARTVRTRTKRYKLIGDSLKNQMCLELIISTDQIEVTSDRVSVGYFNDANNEDQLRQLGRPPCLLI